MGDGLPPTHPRDMLNGATLTDCMAVSHDMVSFQPDGNSRFLAPRVKRRMNVQHRLSELRTISQCFQI